MTIEELLKRLRPFYQRWNEEGHRWRLFAEPTKRQMWVSIAPEGDAAYEGPDAEVTTYDSGYWLLGIGENALTVEIASVTTSLIEAGQVSVLEAHSTTPHSYIRPLVQAVLHDPEIAEVWR